MAETTTYEVRCAGVSYFTREDVLDATGAPRLYSNGNPIHVDVRREAAMGDLIELPAHQADRLLKLGAIQKPGAAPLPRDTGPVATPFSVPMGPDRGFAEHPGGDPRPPALAIAERQAALDAALAADEALTSAGVEVTDVSAMSDDELAGWIRDSRPTVPQVVDAADGDPELASRLIAAERAATGDDPRATLVTQLEAIAKG